MDLSKIKELIELVKATGIAELEVEADGERVYIASATGNAPLPAAAPAAATGVEPPPQVEDAVGSVVPAPLSGTFYRAPAPGEKPFVDIGDSVAVGDVLCIIESMKMMNQVKSECAGEVAAVLLDDGQAIESGTGLFRIL